MANCPSLVSVLADDMCQENLAGVGTTVYVGRKADLKAALTATENVYSCPEAASGATLLYKIECQDEGQQIQGSSLGPNKGFKLQFDFTIEMVNEMTAKLGRALNNLRDLFFIVKDGDVSQIMYDADRKVKFESDGIKTDTGKAAADDRLTTASASLQPVRYPNLYVTEPEAGWDSLCNPANE